MHSSETAPRLVPILNLARSLFYFCLCAGAGATELQAGALEDYLQQPDTNFAWVKIDEKQSEGFTVAHLQVTSQLWRTNLWTHHVQIARPEKVRNPGIAFLYITGDGNGLSSVEMLKTLAGRAGAIAAVVTRVPNQPLYDGRKEDALIAYTFDQFLKTGDQTWPLLFPMTKSAVRAMDAVQAYARQEWRQKIDQFVVGGASKRGWTTWLTGAVDPRVKAIVPIVIDVVNVRPSMMNHYAVYGFWAPAVGNYAEQHKVMDRWDSPRMEALNKIEDPYFYLDRLTLPKYVVNAAGDQFFTPDSSRFYFDDLKGPKYLRYVPNGDHSLRGTDAADSILAFYRAIVEGSPLPKFKWKMEKDGSITVETETKPREVNLW